MIFRLQSNGDKRLEDRVSQGQSQVVASHTPRTDRPAFGKGAGRGADSKGLGRQSICQQGEASGQGTAGSSSLKKVPFHKTYAELHKNN